MKRILFLSLVFIWGCSSISPKDNREPASFGQVDIVRMNKGECQIAIIVGGTAAPPTYEEMLELIAFKPQAKLAVGAYLKLKGDQDPKKFLDRMKTKDLFRFVNYPLPADIAKDCASVDPLAKELTQKLSTRSSTPSTPQSSEPRGGPNGDLYPSECFRSHDPNRCRDEVEARDPNWADSLPATPKSGR